MVCTLVHAIIRSGGVRVGDKGGGKVEGGDERIVACTCLRPLLDDVCDVFKGDIASDPMLITYEHPKVRLYAVRYALVTDFLH